MAKEETIALKISHISKQYPGVKALDDVSLEIRRGEVHALMGENGAGKSTLIKIVAGAVSPDSGEIFVGDARIEAMTAKRSKELGIAVIYQELLMIPALTAAENVFLGTKVTQGGLVNHREMEQRAAAIFEELGVHIEPGARVSSLSTAYQQMIEIARALVKNAKILIMDEPSAMLTEDEVETMFQVIARLKAAGVTVIYISHRLEEVFHISDRISILRDGRYITTLETDKTNKAELIHYMVGRELHQTFPPRPPLPEGLPVGLEVCHFTGNGVKDISLCVHHGEILGLGGLVGAGRTELAQLIFGMAKLEQGELRIEGKPVKVRHPKDAVALRIGLVPEDRKGQGLLSDYSLVQNISLPSIRAMSKSIFVSQSAEHKAAEAQRQKLNIKTPSMEQLGKNLSGGNQQKVVLAKWLVAQCDYLIFDEPTRGIDVGAKKEIYTLLNELAGQGKCILMISSEMEELMGISDRIVILHEGEFAGELQREAFSQDRILAIASGEKGVSLL